ncbi:MAG TPA: hypothetical protein VJ912_03550 [Candidatus Nanoarchaeia archaeon]|nr:hypothetical protein [Candidatus Nanoarchaeia archaeon]
MQKRLVNYIKRYIGKYSEEDIRKRLLNSGWKEEKIDSAIEYVKSQEEGKKKSERKASKKIPNKRLVNYIKNYMGKYPENKIKKKLVSSGWKEEKIDSAIEYVKSQEEGKKTTKIKEERNSRLINYLKKYLLKYPEKKVRKRLLKSGWKEEKIDSAIEYVKSQEEFRKKLKKPDKRLVNYISKYIKKYREERIKKKLIGSGWKEEKIDSAIEYVKKGGTNGEIKPDKRLVNYISKYISKYPENRIKKKLVSSGWKEKNVDVAMHYVKKKKGLIISPEDKKYRRTKTFIIVLISLLTITAATLLGFFFIGDNITEAVKSTVLIITAVLLVFAGILLVGLLFYEEKFTNFLNKIFSIGGDKKRVRTHETREWKGIKHRSPALMVLLSLITGGLFFIIWLILTTIELRKNSKTALSPYWLFVLILPLISSLLMTGVIPVNFQEITWMIVAWSFNIISAVVMIIYYWKYSSAINELSDFSSVGLFFLFIFIWPVAQVISQVKLNKKSKKVKKDSNQENKRNK